MNYATAICRECKEAIYDSQGEVDKKGFWICNKCVNNKINKKQEKKDNGD
jgi:formylmethanofuran dehydrogenase subunit E